ncbi:MAG TPA: 4-carboxymuconolactone decarboxylase [Terriglobales bacterium]|nr:4-carboxymuconolactone decarboxylase [Terriglobales bacterium]
MDKDDTYSRGMHVRRAVLGDAHVDRATAQATELDRDFQEFLTKYAWGEIWSREGLPTSTRRLLTLAMLVSLNREEEFRMHVRAALDAGVTTEEIKEVLLHTAIYCGLPAANAAFKAAREIIAST